MRWRRDAKLVRKAFRARIVIWAIVPPPTVLYVTQHWAIAKLQHSATGRLTADPGCGLTTSLCHAVQSDWRTAGLSPPTPPELDFPAVDRSGRMKEARLISSKVTSRGWNKTGNLSHPSRPEPSLPRASGVCVRRACAHVEPSAKDPNGPLTCPWSRLTSVASSTLEGPFPP